MGSFRMKVRKRSGLGSGFVALRPPGGSRATNRLRRVHGLGSSHTTRKPVPHGPEFHPSERRAAERHSSGSDPQEPPRRTLVFSPSGPFGSFRSRLSYSAIPSAHHSAALPCMSYSPQAFGAYVPT